MEFSKLFYLLSLDKSLADMMKEILENFIGPKIFYDFLMVKILKKIFLINEELNQKSPLIQKIVHRVFGSRSGNFEAI